MDSPNDPGRGVVCSWERLVAGSSGFRGGLPLFLCSTSRHESYCRMSIAVPGPKFHKKTHSFIVVDASVAWSIVVTSQMFPFTVDTSRCYMSFGFSGCSWRYGFLGARELWQCGRPMARRCTRARLIETRRGIYRSLWMELTRRSKPIINSRRLCIRP